MRRSSLAAGLTAIALTATACASSGASDSPVSSRTTVLPPTVVDGFVEFSPQQYVDLWLDLQPLAGTVTPDELPSITGDSLADEMLRDAARRRGYVEQTLAVSGSLDERLVAAFAEMQAAAAVDGVGLAVTSGFRSVERQREIILGKVAEVCIRRLGRSCHTTDFASGAIDEVVDEILAVSSLPGFSGHHTGRIIDIGDSTTSFVEPGTPGYEWLAAADFANAKRFGFAPRYPFGASPQGPDPEPWEFFWAGTSHFVPATGS